MFNPQLGVLQASPSTPAQQACQKQGKHHPRIPGCRLTVSSLPLAIVADAQMVSNVIESISVAYANDSQVNVGLYKQSTRSQKERSRCCCAFPCPGRLYLCMERDLYMLAVTLQSPWARAMLQGASSVTCHNCHKGVTTTHTSM